MISCRYVGGDSSCIADREFDAVGQKAALSEEGYRDAILGGAAFIPEKQFESLGFTSDELEKFGPLGVRVDPTDSFCRKLSLGQQIFRDIRDQLLVGDQRVLAEVSD